MLPSPLLLLLMSKGLAKLWQQLAGNEEQVSLMMKLRQQFKTDQKVPSEGLKQEHQQWMQIHRHISWRRMTFWHPRRKFSHNRDSFISDTSLSEKGSVQDDSPVSLLIFKKGSISHCYFLFSGVPDIMTVPLYSHSHLLCVLWLSEFILLAGFTEEIILESTAVGRQSWWPSRQGDAFSEMQEGSCVGKQQRNERSEVELNCKLPFLAKVKINRVFMQDLGHVHMSTSLAAHLHLDLHFPYHD